MSILKNISERFQPKGEKLPAIGVPYFDLKNYGSKEWKKFVVDSFKTANDDSEIDLEMAGVLIEEFFRGMRDVYQSEFKRFDELVGFQPPNLKLTLGNTHFNAAKQQIWLNIDEFAFLAGKDSGDLDLTLTLSSGGNITGRQTKLEIMYSTGVEEMHHAIEFFRHPEHFQDEPLESDTELTVYDAQIHEMKALAQQILLAMREGHSPEGIALMQLRMSKAMPEFKKRIKSLRAIEQLEQHRE